MNEEHEKTGNSNGMRRWRDYTGFTGMDAEVKDSYGTLRVRMKRVR
jgi:hypothetical protein